jgi:hypothetical protein
MRRLLSPAGFLLVAVCFLLPFVTVACTPQPGDTMSATYRGTDLVTGGRATIGLSEGFEHDVGPAATAYGLPTPTTAVRDRYARPIAAQPLLAATLVLTIAAIVLSGLGRAWPRALTGFGAAVLTLMTLIGGEIIAVHAARIRVTTDAAPAVGAASPDQLALSPGATITPTPRYGFWLALLLLALLAVGNAIRLVWLTRSGPTRRAEPRAPS